jgi:hypothetical protein
MNAFKKFLIVSFVAVALAFAAESAAMAQVQYGPWLPSVPSANEPFMYYHPNYQPWRATGYYWPGYYQPYSYTYSYPYGYPYGGMYAYRRYYYVPSRRSVWIWRR